MISFLLITLARLVSVYSTLCFIRIILTWIPQLNYSYIGKILSSLCDPYLNLFSKIPLRIGMIDFSAMLALGALYVLSSILGSINLSGYISFSMILSHLISMLWSILSSVLTVIFLIFFIRWLVCIFSRTSNQYDSPWQRFDDAIKSKVYKLSSFFTGRKTIPYRIALFIDALAVLGIGVLCWFLLGIILRLVSMIPF